MKNNNRFLYYAIFSIVVFMLLTASLFIVDRKPIEMANGSVSDRAGYKRARAKLSGDSAKVKRVEKISGKSVKNARAKKKIEKKTPDSAKKLARISKPRGRLYFVIDDVGNSTTNMDLFLKIKFPVTYSILPQLPFTKECARILRANNKEIMMHFPMEAIGGKDPGPGAIYLEMSEAEVRETIEENLRDLPLIRMVNNHQGSLITADREKMTLILGIFKEKNIKFLDSLTTGKSVVGEVSKDLGLTYIKRNSIFLDNEKNKESMLKAIESGFEVAAKNGYAVMIGHIWSSELAEALNDIYPEMIEYGYLPENLSELFKNEKER